MPSLAPLDASMIESLARRSDDNVSHGEGGLALIYRAPVRTGANLWIRLPKSTSPT